MQICLARPGVAGAVLRLTCGGRELCDGSAAACVTGVVLCLVHHVDPRDKGTALSEPETVYYSDLDTLPPDWVRQWIHDHLSVPGRWPGSPAHWRPARPAQQILSAQSLFREVGVEALVAAQMDSVDPSAVLGWTFGILLIAVAAWHTFSGALRPAAVPRAPAAQLCL